LFSRISRTKNGLNLTQPSMEHTESSSRQWSHDLSTPRVDVMKPFTDET
jgi:hypothetical protein